MKKFISLLSAVILMILLNLFTVNAAPVDAAKATKIANGKITAFGKASLFSIVSIEIIGQDDQVLCYLFRMQPAGFMIVTADDNLPPVIAYDFLSDFPYDNENENPILQMIRADINLRLANVSRLPESVIMKRNEEWQQLMNPDGNIKPDVLFEQWPPQGTTSTGGWLETNWTQSAPYNNFCPMDPVTNNRSVAGCPATAMAQIVNYYQTINNTVFSDNDDYHHNYAGRNYWIDDDYIEIDFPCFPDLNAYLDTLAMSFESGSPLKNNEKAALTFGCGVAAHQVYTSQGSGTFGVDQAEDAYLRFGFTNALLLEGTDTSLYTHLAQNIMEARPAHLAVVNPSWTSGHNVVADGYNTDDYFHLNFGWGGSYNGWYLLPDEIPYGLTVIEGLVVDIAYAPVNTGYVNQNELDGSFRIYPNPASETIHVEFEVCKTSQVTIDLYNSSGCKVFSIHKELTVNGTYTEKVDLKSIGLNLTSGLYFCQLQTEGKIVTRQFVVK